MRFVSLKHWSSTVFFLFAFCFVPFAGAQTNPVSPGLALSLQTKLDQLRTNQNLKGLSATIIVPGEGTWRGMSGISHAGVAIDSNMVFGIGSATKNLVAATIMMLQEDSLLSINDPIHLWLPVYPNIDSTITIRQLLQHKSGIYNYTDNSGWQNAINSNPGQIWSADSVLNSFVSVPYFAPGASFHYSNTNYLLLGRIIEEVTGNSVTAELRNRIFQPYQLSSFYMEQLEPATGIMPHNWSDPSLSGVNATDLYNFPKTAIWTSSAAAGGLMATSFDLARWCRLLFSGQVLQPASLSQMLQFQNVSGGMTGYGLGVMRLSNQGQTVWGHAGNLAGFASCMVYSPTDSITVSILSNQDVIGQPLALAMLRQAQQYLVTGISGDLDSAKSKFSCFPNPANRAGQVSFEITKPEQVEIRLLNSIGQTVQVIADEQLTTGTHSYNIDAGKLPAGLYFCSFQTSVGTQVARWMISE